MFHDRICIANPYIFQNWEQEYKTERGNFPITNKIEKVTNYCALLRGNKWVWVGGFFWGELLYNRMESNFESSFHKEPS